MDGILPLWKERGMTSHDCVFRLRKILHTKKVGHGGTLDPDVCGVLPICVGKGTKVIEYLVSQGKTYEGEITLGFATDTEDASGQVVAQQALTEPFSSAEIDAAMASFLGEIIQVPPMYSAVKVNGKRLYEYAREGIAVERPKRVAQIERFERLGEPIFDEEQQTQRWRFRVVCGKGTYVRTLAVDTGAKLGVPAHMSELTRTASGGLQAADCFTLEQVAEYMDKQAVAEILQPIEVAVQAFPRIDLSPALYQKVKNGARLSLTELGLTEPPTDLLALFYQAKVVSLYMAHPTKKDILKPSKVLRNEQ